MSWLRRKHDTSGESSGDPRIDYARRVMQHPQSGQCRRGTQDEHPNDVPRGVDSDFCYGEDSCA